MQTPVVILYLLGLGAHAFPNMSPPVLEKMAANMNARGIDAPKVPRATQTMKRSVSSAETNCGPLTCAVFDEAEQKVSTTGQYAYASPAADEIRKSQSRLPLFLFQVISGVLLGGPSPRITSPETFSVY